MNDNFQHIAGEICAFEQHKFDESHQNPILDRVVLRNVSEILRNFVAQKPVWCKKGGVLR